MLQKSLSHRRLVHRDRSSQMHVLHMSRPVTFVTFVQIVRNARWVLRFPFRVAFVMAARFFRTLNQRLLLG
jgi:hypothetical protein